MEVHETKDSITKAIIIWYKKMPTVGKTILVTCALISLFILLTSRPSSKQNQQITTNVQDATTTADWQVAEAAADKAKQALFDSSPAGKLCANHLDWTNDDCANLVARKIWIGMSYDMLVYLEGKPDHVNTSNYGSGNQYQFCWDYSTPSCFYSKEDGIIYSYN